MNRYEQIISACGFSEEMECYLIGCKLNDYNMLDIILGAPLPLTEKRKLLELLNTPDSDGYADVSKCIREFDDALAALELKTARYSHCPSVGMMMTYWMKKRLLRSRSCLFRRLLNTSKS